MQRSTSARRMAVSQDLLPWADPYIASLMQKVARSGGRLFKDTPAPAAELPSSEEEEFDAGSPYFADDRSQRGVWRPE